MRSAGGVESNLATTSNYFDAAIEYIRGCEERKARVLMNVIIPAEEFLAPRSRMKKRFKALRIVGLVPAPCVST